MPNLPPWLIPSDPAPAALRGFTVGAQIGQHRAEQRFREAQMARQEQLAAMDQARWEAEIGMKAAESARRHDAQMQYRQAIEGGMDPLDAMIRFGPEMGQQGSAEAAAIRAMYQKEKPVQTWEERTLPGGGRVMMGSQGGILNLPAEPKPTDKWIEGTRKDASGREVPVKINQITGDVEPIFSSAPASQELYPAKQQIDTVQSLILRAEDQINELESDPLYGTAIEKKDKDRTQFEKGAVRRHESLIKRRSDLEQQLQDLYQQFQGGTRASISGATTPTGKPRFIYDQASGQFSASGSAATGAAETVSGEPGLLGQAAGATLRGRYGGLGMARAMLPYVRQLLPRGALPPQFTAPSFQGVQPSLPQSIADEMGVEGPAFNPVSMPVAPTNLPLSADALELLFPSFR